MSKDFPPSYDIQIGSGACLVSLQWELGAFCNMYQADYTSC